ncbi:hypothetical protein AMATHDRAFT_69619 [Amanita thiersii Skay4041]|uniref:Methyltransferase domain-containing protein n=1 Tax=Amanita thiersii Skay4041 TaxID=703135 RepID=A0A2A9NFN7_9AGAR|nr:hypothetical protein AMATHDRAFT_69619 [Amanita thiersii Skay4041]
MPHIDPQLLHNPRPHFARANTSPSPSPSPQRAISNESLAVAARASTLAAGSAIKKRHSSYALSQSPPPSPSLHLSTSMLKQQHRHPPPPPLVTTPGASGNPSKSAPRSKPNPRRPSQPVAPAPREEITPWEFYPVPPEYDQLATTLAAPPPTIRPRPSVSTGLVEDVTPWDLYPVPDYHAPLEKSPKSSRSRHTRSGRPNSSSGANKTLADFGIGGRRKSTGSKASSSNPSGPSSPRVKPALSTAIHFTNSKLTVQSSPRAPVSSSSVFNGEPISHTTTQTSTTSSVLPPSPSMPRSPLPSRFLPLKKAPSGSKLGDARPSVTDQKFSTADRTILEELKRNISARESQFVKKGKGTHYDSNGILIGQKHHPYPPSVVPYPRNYGREVLDLDVWETAFCQDICGSVTWHVFQSPPIRALDLGCGTGSWILNAAKVWKDCQFVGLDIVPLHPDLQQIGLPDLAARITWVQANFLEKLPFPDDEFDYVHVKRISLGVPEDKWDSLLEEITRVMKPGGAFELIEEDLFFPGKQIDSDSESEGEDESTKRTSWKPSSATTEEPYRAAHDAQLLVPPRTDDEFSTPTTIGSATLPPIPSRSGSPIPIREAAIAEADEPESDEQTRYTDLSKPSSSTTVSPHVVTPTPSRPSLHVKTNTLFNNTSSEQQQYHRQSRTFMTTGNPKRSVSTLSLPASKGTVSPTTGPNYSGETLHANPLSAGSNTSLPPMPMTPLTPVHDSMQMPPQTTDLLRTLPKPPHNPRDHTILERIYTEMLSARFINMSPLSLLANHLGLHFRDLRTHPPIQFTFPPIPKRYRVFGKPIEGMKPGAQEEPVEIPQCMCDQEAEEEAEESRFLSMQALLQHQSRYVSLDETRPTAFSPSTRTRFGLPNRDMKVAAIRRGSRLPNGELKLDLKTLNLHLSLRTAEILACSEAMWEWTESERHRLKRTADEERKRGREREKGSRSYHVRARNSTSSYESSQSPEAQFKARLLEMCRDEFDELLSNFRLDMQDQFVLGYALEDRMDWGISLCIPPPDRVIFDSATESWRRWELQERQSAQAAYKVRAMSTGNLSTASSPLATRAPGGGFGGGGGCGSSGCLGGPPSDEDRMTVRGGGGGENPYKRAGGGGGYQASSNESLVGRQNGQRTRATSRATVVPPTRRLSRALRVFVGWKPQ